MCATHARSAQTRPRNAPTSAVGRAGAQDITDHYPNPQGAQAVGPQSGALAKRLARLWVMRCYVKCVAQRSIYPGTACVQSSKASTLGHGDRAATGTAGLRISFFDPQAGRVPRGQSLTLAGVAVSRSESAGSTRRGSPWRSASRRAVFCWPAPCGGGGGAKGPALASGTKPGRGFLRAGGVQDVRR
jgi:hypothetical protein